MKPAKIHLADKNFQSQHSGKCNLLIRISRNRLSYAIISQWNNQLKVLYDSPVKGIRGLNAVLDSDAFLKFEFNEVKISIETSKFTFIPDEIYSADDLASYAIFVYPTKKQTILVKDIPSAGIKNITAIDKDLVENLIEQFKNPLIVNQVNPLVESALKLPSDPGNNKLFLQFNSLSFEALLLKNNTLQYYNVFNIDSADGFNYFLLAIIKDQQLKHSDTGVILSGDIQAREENYSRIQKYFSNINFADSGKLISETDIFKEVPAHQFFSLFSLNICE